jgi:PDZ domain-containing protein
MQDWRMVLGGVTLAAISGLAIACPPDSDKACSTEAQDTIQTEVSFGSLSSRADDDDVVFGWVGDWSELHGNNTDGPDEEKIEVLIENGEITVIRNGKKLPANAFKREGNHIAFLTKDGDEDQQFVVELVDDDEVVDFTSTAKRPPVMIGIRMGEPDEALRAQLGLGDRQVIMIDDVLDGLPADKAGLRKYDIVVAIDGDDDGVTVSRLSDTLLHKKPGDELKFHVIRGGEKEVVRIKLRAYSAKDLGAETEEDEQIIFEQLGGGANAAEHEARLNEMTERLAQAGLAEEQIEQLRQQLGEVMEQAMRGSRGLSGRVHTDGELRVGPQVAPDGRLTLVPGPRGREMFELRVPGGRNIQVPESMRRRVEVQRQGSGDMERRLEALERRMDEVSDRIESRMTRMMDRFEKLANRIEKSLDDR